MKYILLVLLIQFIPLCISAQKTKNVYGEYIYVVPENNSISQAKEIAINKAKVQAIANEFGTSISQNNFLKIENNANNSNTNFLSISESDVNGEWIEDLEPPKTDIITHNNALAIKATVKGVIRELISSKIDLDIKILCNGIENIHEKSNFKNGDYLFLSIKSPIKGYVAIYLVDEANSAYCLLPYRKLQNGNIPIDANTQYIFFNKKNALPNIKIDKIDQYQLFCNADEEKNQLYIIFSTNPLIKPNDDNSTQTINGLTMPRHLSFDDFYKWLSKTRLRDKQMQIEIKNIIITK